MDGKRLWSATAALAAAALLGACGGGPAAARIARRGQSTGTTPATVKLPNQGGTLPPGPIRPACELVSRDEMAAAVGNPVGPGTGQGRNCFWATAVDGGTSASITAVKPGPGKATADECGRLRLGQPSEGKHEDVSGVGTSAVWVVDTLTTLIQGSIVACWDDSAVMVLLTGERDPSALRATAVNLAQRVRSRS
jgi:hypothetical protein